jgi:hypothetical protein
MSFKSLMASEKWINNILGDDYKNIAKDVAELS